MGAGALSRPRAAQFLQNRSCLNIIGMIGNLFPNYVTVNFKLLKKITRSLVPAARNTGRLRVFEGKIEFSELLYSVEPGPGRAKAKNFAIYREVTKSVQIGLW